MPRKTFGVGVGRARISREVLVRAELRRIDEYAGNDEVRAFASDARFPGVDVRQDWPDEALDELKPDARSAIVTLTHDPKLDDPALDVALRSEAFYIAALGSKRTHAARLERLKDLGHDPAKLGRIVGPAGLSIGAVSPGLDLTMDVQTQRQALDSPGRLDDKLVAAIPIATPETVYDLVYDAAPWGIRLRHSRDWYFFKDSLEIEPRVAIFRLMQKGSIIAQCNMSPLANAAPLAASIITAFFANDRERFRPYMSKSVAAVLTNRRITILQRQIAEALGNLEAIELTAADISLLGDLTVVRVPLRFSQGSTTGVVSFTLDATVLGFRIQPAARPTKGESTDG